MLLRLRLSPYVYRAGYGLMACKHPLVLESACKPSIKEEEAPKLSGIKIPLNTVKEQKKEPMDKTKEV